MRIQVLLQQGAEERAERGHTPKLKGCVLSLFPRVLLVLQAIGQTNGLRRVRIYLVW